MLFLKKKSSQDLNPKLLLLGISMLSCKWKQNEMKGRENTGGVRGCYTVAQLVSRQDILRLKSLDLH